MFVTGRKFCCACRTMQIDSEFTRSDLICDWCARNCDQTPPPRCPLCGMMRKSNQEAHTCCTPEGWREK